MQVINKINVPKEITKKRVFCFQKPPLMNKKYILGKILGRRRTYARLI